MVFVEVGERIHLRAAAELFQTEEGLVFMEAGWPEPLGPHRIHYQEGTPEATPAGWRIGNWWIQSLEEESEPECERAWAAWEEGRRFLEEEYGADTSREAAARVASRAIGQEVKP